VLERVIENKRDKFCRKKNMKIQKNSFINNNQKLLINKINVSLMSIINKLHTLGVNNTLECSVTILDLMQASKMLRISVTIRKDVTARFLGAVPSSKGWAGPLKQLFLSCNPVKIFSIKTR